MSECPATTSCWQFFFRNEVSIFMLICIIRTLPLYICRYCMPTEMYSWRASRILPSQRSSLICKTLLAAGPGVSGSKPGVPDQGIQWEIGGCILQVCSGHCSDPGGKQGPCHQGDPREHRVWDETGQCECLHVSMLMFSSNTKTVHTFSQTITLRHVTLEIKLTVW